MNYDEAIEWLEGKRSSVNYIPREPIETFDVRVAQCDAAMTQIAYFIAKHFSNQPIAISSIPIETPEEDKCKCSFSPMLYTKGSTVMCGRCRKPK